jgi:hypothetical protein
LDGPGNIGCRSGLGRDRLGGAWKAAQRAAFLGRFQPSPQGLPQGVSSGAAGNRPESLRWKYLDAGQADRLYNEAPHIFNAGDFDYERAGAWLAGHDAAKLISRHSPDPGRIEERVRSILMPEIEPGGPLRLVGEVIDMDMSAVLALKLLAAFLAGFNGEQRP